MLNDLDFCSFVWRALIFGLDYFDGDLFPFKRKERRGGGFCLSGFLDYMFREILVCIE